MKNIKKVIRMVLSKSDFIRYIVTQLYIISESVENSKSIEASYIAGIKLEIKEKILFKTNPSYFNESMKYISPVQLSKNEREAELKSIYYKKTRKYLDLNNPVTFTQKIQWLKLYYVNNEMARCADRVEMKKYIIEQIGEEYVINNLGIYSTENDIDFEIYQVPFIIRSSIESKYLLIVNHMDLTDWGKIRTILASWLLAKNTLCWSFGKAYWKKEPQLLVEEYIPGLYDEAFKDDDFKIIRFYCYNGLCKHFEIIFKGKHYNYDLNYQCILMDSISDFTNVHFFSKESLDKLMSIAEKLAKPFPFARISIVKSKKQIFVNDIEFYPNGGYMDFINSWDEKLGSYLELPF